MLHKVGRPLQPPTGPVLFETYHLRRISNLGSMQPAKWYVLNCIGV